VKPQGSTELQVTTDMRVWELQFNSEVNMITFHTACYCENYKDGDAKCIIHVLEYIYNHSKMSLIILCVWLDRPKDVVRRVD
jgi:hypothetical protein